MSKQSGFTLIELVMVIVILGILGAIAVPKFVNLSSDATDAAKRGMSGAVKAAHSIAIAENKTLPDIDTLITYVSAEGLAAANSGVSVDINGSASIVPTFTDQACSVATTATTDIVACVGTIP